MIPISKIKSVRRRKNLNNSFSSSETNPFLSDPHKQQQQVEDKSDGVVAQGKSPDLRTLFRRFWKVAAPYWTSDDKVEARLRLAGVFALTLATTGISVGFNFLARDFSNALSNKDQEQFTRQLLYYLGAFALGIPFFVLRDYARDSLSLRWRSWMTRYYMDRYLKDHNFYKIQSQSIIDNPDQRIVDDLSSFTGTALSLSLKLFNAVVDLITFSNILYGIYRPLFFVLIVYSIGGTAISVFLGKGLVNLNFLQEKKEADFRYGLVRIRENAESIAFYGGEESEMQLLLQRFSSAFQNLSKMLISSRNLEFFTDSYRYVIRILPAAVVAPMYFSGKIEFGVISQSVSAFNHILGDFSLIVYQLQAITAFSAVLNRLGEFDDVLDRSSSKSLSNTLEDIHISYNNFRSSSVLESNGSVPSEKYETLLEVEKLTLKTPCQSTLIKDLSLIIKDKDNLLVMGPSGSGKTSLLRAMAGLLKTGTGKIMYYVKDGQDPKQSMYSDVNYYHDACEEHGTLINKRSQIFFLPQRPYMVLGTLRQQLLYPRWADGTVPRSDSSKPSNMLPFLANLPNSDHMKDKPMKPTTDELIQVLEDVHLGYLLARFSLDSTHEWSSVLSLGEQQRLAFARLLLSKPKLVLLDESTSALDEANEVHLYNKIGEAGITYISVGHRSTLCNYHNRILCISTVDAKNEQPNWYIEPTRHESSLKNTNLPF